MNMAIVYEVGWECSNLQFKYHKTSGNQAPPTQNFCQWSDWPVMSRCENSTTKNYWSLIVVSFRFCCTYKLAGNLPTIKCIDERFVLAIL